MTIRVDWEKVQKLLDSVEGISGLPEGRNVDKNDGVKMKFCTCSSHEGPNPLPESEFSIRNSSKGWLQSWCKECVKTYSRDHHEKTKQSNKRECKGCGKEITNKNKSGLCPSCAQKGKKASAETKKKLSAVTSGEKNPRFKGGSYTYFHNKAWKKFGKNRCERCGISLEKYLKPDCEKRLNKRKRRFDMHCTSNPKNYIIMEEYNWMCLCGLCHVYLESKLEGHVKEIVKHYTEDFWTIDQIADKYRSHRTSIIRLLKKYKIKVERRNKLEMHKEEIIRLYTEELWSINRIANQYVSSHGFIQKLLERYGIKIEKRYKSTLADEDVINIIKDESKTQAELAKETGVNPSQISRIKTGKSRNKIQIQDNEQ